MNNTKIVDVKFYRMKEDTKQKLLQYYYKQWLKNTKNKSNK